MPCPKSVQYEAVSRTTSPVTHTAETAVKSASEKEAEPAPFEEPGSMSIIVPKSIAHANPKIIILDAEKYFRFNFIIKITNLIAYIYV